MAWVALQAAETLQTNEQRLRVLSWNIHHGEGVDGRLDLDRIATTIRSGEADLVALQEVDRGVARTSRRDLPGELAALTGMTAVFSNNFAFQGGEYGNAILSALPVISWTNRHYNMLREGEQRGLLQVTVDWGGKPLRFFCTHLDFRPDDSERVSHVAEIRDVVEGDPVLPVIVAGDFNARPDTEVYRAATAFLLDAWVTRSKESGYTFSSAGPDRRIDYVFFCPPTAFEVTRVQVLDSDASDHLPVLVEFRVPTR
jgi:endonuclease/exonuclease/phosphatase family metal-dependent hydrolase